MKPAPVPLVFIFSLSGAYLCWYKFSIVGNPFSFPHLKTIPGPQNLLPFFVFFFGILGVNLFQIYQFPPINLIDGTGYDGFWYLKATKEFLPADTDDYHLFRLLPATLVYWGNSLLGIPPSNLASIRGFQHLNLVLILFALCFAELLCRYYRFSTLRRWLFFSLLFVNFHVFKDSWFNSMMTDSMSFCLAMGLVYFTVSDKKWGFILCCLLSYFTIPLMAMFFLGERIIRRIDTEDQSGESVIHLVRWLGNLFIFGLAALTLFIVFYLGNRTVFVYPDDINVYLLPVSILTLSFSLYYIIWRHRDVFGLFPIALNRFSRIWGWEAYTMIVLFLIQIVVSSWNGNPPKTFAWYFVLGIPLVLNLKPLIGIFDNLVYLGPVIAFFMVNTITGRLRLTRSQLFLSFFACLFLIKPEARHTNLFLPFLALLVVAAIPEDRLTVRWVAEVFMVAVLFSKIWYPVHWADFPPGYVIFTKGFDMGYFQTFPAQHYFMFQGPMISHAMYLVWALPIGGLFFYGWYRRSIFG